MAFTSGSNFMISLYLLAEKHNKIEYIQWSEKSVELKRNKAQKPAIDIPSSTRFPIHLLQQISFVAMECSYYEWTFRDILKLTMFPLFFNSGLPLQYHILNLKILFFDLPVKCLLYFVLRLLMAIIYFLLFFLQNQQLVYSPLNSIRLLLQSLHQFHN